MNLATVITISHQGFEDRKYDEIQRGDIMMHFMRDELGFTPEKFQQLINSGSTMVNGSPIEGTDMGRFFVWYYINYIIDHVAEDC
jgi:hypothetical protein